MKKTRFNIYFPILYYLGELFVIVFSTQLMLYYTFTKFSYVNVLFIGFWFLISILFKSHVLGRDISKFKLVQSTLKSLFFFSGSVSILNLLFFQLEFYLTTIFFAASLFYFLMLLYRLTVDTILEKYRATGGNILKCLIIGNNEHGSSLSKKLLNILNLVTDRTEFTHYNSNKKSKSIPFLGKFVDLEESYIKQFDRIYFSSKLKIKSQEKIIKIAEDLNVKVSSIPDLPYYDFKNFFISKISSVPYISINKLPLDNSFNVLIKRVFDVVFSSLVIVFILSWMIPLFGLFIKFSSKGPVLFVQKRDGFKGITFNCFKFRTMVINKVSDTKNGR